MAITATATPSLNIGYTLANSQGIATTSETSSVGYADLLFTDGSGTGNVIIGNVISSASINNKKNYN